MSHCTEAYNHLPTGTNTTFTTPVSLSGLPERKIDDFHVFGCEVWYHEPNTKLKLMPCVKPGLLLSYLKNNSGYFILDLETCRLVKSTSCCFFDSSFPGTPPQVETVYERRSERAPWPSLLITRDPDPPQQPDQHPPSPEPPSPPALRLRPTRSRRQPTRYGEYGRTAVVNREQDPATYKKATKSVNWEAWRKAAVAEF